jgi:hypothetical protein
MSIRYQGCDRAPDVVRRLAEEMQRGYERELEIGSEAYWAEQYEAYRRSTRDVSDEWLE